MSSDLYGPDNRPLDAMRQEVHEIAGLPTKVFSDPTVVPIPITPEGLTLLIAAGDAKAKRDLKVKKGEGLKQAILLLSQNQGVIMQISGALVREVAALRERVKVLTAALADRAGDELGAAEPRAKLANEPSGKAEGSGSADDPDSRDGLN